MNETKNEYVRWSLEEGRLVSDENPIPNEQVVMIRWARVVDGVVMESPMDYPVDPNVYYQNISDPPPTFFECPDTQVDCWWLYDEGTSTYSPPAPITDPPLGGIPSAMNVEDILVELKNNPELLEELRQLLMK